MNQKLVNENIILELISPKQLVDGLETLQDILIGVSPLPNDKEALNGQYHIVGGHGRKERDKIHVERSGTEGSDTFHRNLTF
jgi:hypothetical protein